MKSAMENESRTCFGDSDGVKTCILSQEEEYHAKGFDPNRGRLSPLSVFSFPGNGKQSVFTLMIQITQQLHVVFSCSAQFHCIPFIPDAPMGVLLVYPVLLGTL